MKLAVIGTKEFSNYALLKEKLSEIHDIELIVSGGAPGADALATRFARKHKIYLLEFPPNHIKHDKEAKHVRDKQIVDNCDVVIAFWDGVCEGTKFTLDYAKTKKKKVIIINI